MFKNLAALWRHVTKNKVSVTLNVTGLAVGIAICMLISIWAEHELSFDNFHHNAQAKFRIWNTFTSEAETFSQAPSGVALGAHLPKHVADITNACRVFNSDFKVRYQDQSYFEDNVIIADSTFFSFFNFPIIAGPKENLLTDPDEIVITRSTALKYFGTVENAIDKVLLMDDDPVTVAAVAENAPSNSHIQFDIVFPYKALHTFALNQYGQDLDNQWLGGWPRTYIEIRDGARWEEVETRVNQIVAQHSRKDWEDNKMSYQYFLQTIQDIHLRSNLRYDAPNNGSSMTVSVFIAVAVLVLLLACFNYINLTTATAAARAKEISLRKVAGASKPQLVRQFFGETFMTTVIAVVVGIAIAQIALPFFSGWMGQPYKLPTDAWHLAALASFVIMVTILSGGYPALVLSSFQPITALRGKFFSSARGQTFRQGLVVLQFSISIVLLIAILTVNRQMQFIHSKPLGYDGTGILTVAFNGDQAVRTNYDVIRDALLSASSIESTSLHSGNVVGGLGNGWITAQDAQGKEIVTSIYRQSVDPDYFETYKMEFAAGRGFTAGTSDSAKAVVINEAAARNLGWTDPEDALGTPFGTGENARFVIGVIRDFHFENLHTAVQPLLIGYNLGGNQISVRVRTADIRSAIAHLEQTWARLVPDVPLQYSFLDESLAQQYNHEQRMEVVLYVFASVAFFIACLGLFGLSTFLIRQRLREISIRKVLGASVSGLVLLLTREYSRLVLVSALVACPIGYLLMQEWLSTFTYHTSISWLILIVALVVPLLIAVLTVSAQAIRAALVNAAKILRAD